MEKKIFHRLIQLVNQLERKVYEPLYDQNYVDDNKAWDYVCYSFAHFLHHLEEAKRILGRKKAKFIDVGCGLGSKVHLAQLYFDSYGIELNSKYHQVAKEINTPRTFHKYGRYETQKYKKKILKKNALSFDYSPYDVIYFFRPLNEQKLQEKLEKRIFKTCKPGTIIIPIFSQSTFPKWIRHLPTPSNEIYMKLKDDRRAAEVDKKIVRLFK